MDTPTRDFQRGAIRVSDAERDQAVAELNEHYQAGRLTLEEFDNRSNLALRARTGSDLTSIFADLPKGATAAVRAPAVPADDGGRRAGRPVVARAIIACVIAAIILGNVAGGLGQHHLGWFVPVAILGVVCLRLSRRR